MNDNIKKHLLALVIIFVSALLSSFLFNNMDIFSLKKSDRRERVISDIKYKGFKKDGNKLIALASKEKKIEISYDGYVKKLLIDYSSSENVEMRIRYDYKNSYDKIQSKKKDDFLLLRFNKSIIPLKNNIKKVTITFDKDKIFEIKDFKVLNNTEFNKYLFYLIFTFLISIYVLYSYYKNNLFRGKIERLFLVLCLLIGSAFIILQPNSTCYSWDDQIHFKNIFEKFELDGKAEYSKGFKDLTDIYPFKESVDTKDERSIQDNYLNKNDKITEEVDTPLVITYNEVGYIIPAIVVKICMFLGLGTTATVVLTKLSILLIYSVVMYFAIKIIPYGKRVMSLFGLLPTVIFVATQFSYDPPLISGICLYIAMFLKIRCDREKLDLKKVLLLLIPIIVASFIKAIYVPLLLLTLFIPRECFRTDRERKMFKIGVIMIFILIMLTFIIPTVSGATDLGDFRGGETSVSGQIKTILSNPIGYVQVLYSTMGKTFIDKLIGPDALFTFSYILTLSKTTNLYFVILGLFVFTVFTDNENYKSKDNKLRIINIIINLIVIILIWTAMYVAFTPVGEMSINGVQHRYFIPLILPIVLLSITNSKIKFKFNSKKYETIIMSIITLVLFYALYKVFFLYFCI